MDESTGRSESTSRIGGLEQLGHYELICVMSHAEYGSTWACISTSAPNLGKVFCLRRIVLGAGDEEKIGGTLMKAARAWEGVTRPGLLPIVDAIAQADRLGIVSEYLEGEPLRSVLNLSRLRKMPVPRPVAFRVATDLRQSLVSLIGASLKKPELANTIHGGILPDVVLLGANGETRLMEPGVTVEVRRTPALMGHEKLLAYQAPEQLSGERVDGRTDVFAVGVLLWEMLASRSLFLPKEGKSEPDRMSDAVRKRIQETAAPRLDDPKLALDPPVDKATADVVERALQKKASARFRSMQELSTAFRKAVGPKTGTRKDVGAYLSELIGSTLETRRAAIKRASMGASVEPVPVASGSTVQAASHDALLTSGEADIDVDMDFGEGDDLEELQPEPLTGKHAGPPVPPPRIQIKSASAKRKWPSPPSLLSEPKAAARPGGPPRPGKFPAPPNVNADAAPVPVPRAASTKAKAASADTVRPPAGKADAQGAQHEAPDQANEDSKRLHADEKKEMAAKPEAAKPEDGKGDTAKPDAAKPDATEPDAAKPDAAKPDAAKPDAKEPDAAKPDAKEPDAGEDAEGDGKTEKESKGGQGKDQASQGGDDKEKESAEAGLFDSPFGKAASGAGSDAASESAAGLGLGRETPLPTGDEKQQETVAVGAMSQALGPDEALAERKRKLKFIVGGVVGLAAIVLVIAVAVSSGDAKDDAGSAPSASTTVPVALASTAQPKNAEDDGVKASDAGLDADASSDASEDASEDAAKDVAEDIAKDAKKEAGKKKRHHGRLPRRPPRKPKPYDPSGI